MDNLDIAAIMPYVTSLVAIIAPVVTAWITSRTTLRIKRLDIISGSLQTTLNNFTEAYARFRSMDVFFADERTPEQRKAQYEVQSTGFALIASIDDNKTQKLILSFLETVSNCYGSVGTSTDELMGEIMLSMSRIITDRSP